MESESKSETAFNVIPSKNRAPEFEAFRVTLQYSACILLLPILAFVLSKMFIFDGIYSKNIVTSNVCSAAVAILVLHVALGAYIYKAYLGGEKTTKKE